MQAIVPPRLHLCVVHLLQNLPLSSPFLETEGVSDSKCVKDLMQETCNRATKNNGRGENTLKIHLNHLESKLSVDSGDHNHHRFSPALVGLPPPHQHDASLSTHRRAEDQPAAMSPVSSWYHRNCKGQPRQPVTFSASLVFIFSSDRSVPPSTISAR